jgi:hypothetical protein
MKVLLTFENIAEVSHLRNRLMKSEFLFALRYYLKQYL